MTQKAHHLNLARKWRSRTFDELIGQDVAVSMLRNSLYKNHFFPVYLFAGQKGCGKTSSARILAAAANCEQLPIFQQDPTKASIPCLTCASCERMYNGTHADFIEIDAASHTGVDDVRTLLDSCNFMPLMGSKKVYLIDEAHMLSKAAFNAFLKVLEEPPAQVLFMLATTEIHKIPETVRSRCFQLHFNPIDRTLLHKHLTAICSDEKIDADAEALSLIVHETDGSARDAINLLEQVRFTSESINAVHVRQALGIMSPNRLGELMALMVENKPTELLTQLKSLSFTTLNASRLWQLLLGLVRTLIWQAYNVAPADQSMILPTQLYERITAAASRNRLHAILQLLWEQEELFLATPYKHAFLEKLFLDICEQVNLKEISELKALLTEEQKKNPTSRLAANNQPHVTRQAAHLAQKSQASPSKNDGSQVKPKHITPAPGAREVAVTPPPVMQAPSKPEPGRGSANNAWQTFCSAIGALNDPILHSIFSQAKVESVDPSTSRVRISLISASPFFKEKIAEAKQQWQPLLAEHFAGCTTLSLAQGNSAPPPRPRVEPPNISISIPDRPTAAPPNENGYQAKKSYERKSKRPQLATRPRGTILLINEDNKGKWPQAELLISHFPGRLELLGEKQ